MEAETVESVSQYHPACRLSSALFRTNGCPLNREEDCDLCGVVAFEPWYCSQVGDALIECPPGGCSLGECALAKSATPNQVGGQLEEERDG